MELLYTAEATATGGRRAGRARSADGELDVRIAPPKEVGGPGGATNPEQLFAAGYAACFDNSLTLIARWEKLQVGETSVTALVGLGREDDGGFGLDVELRVSVPGLPRDQADALVAKAHRLCPYSRATRGNLDVRITLV
ncbi:MAG TPA: organic hydroperoxide resistance protein [Actinomycetota bacterium]|jgi:Ohr subfamily peroxiredoxin|nr:organic hydroperoxide resistance protein [Actinomycetota bacterium]